jgi:hypothetical protein
VIFLQGRPREQYSRNRLTSLQVRLAFLVLVKTAQRLGYFVKLAEVPPSIVVHIGTCLATKPMTKVEMRDFDLNSERQHQRLLEQVRRFLGIQAVTGATTEVIESTAREAAQTKHELADIINVVIVQLIRQRFELPGFSTLLRTARRIRSQVNDELFRLLSGALSPALKLKSTTCSHSRRERPRADSSSNANPKNRQTRKCAPIWSIWHG